MNRWLLMIGAALGTMAGCEEKLDPSPGDATAISGSPVTYHLILNDSGSMSVSGAGRDFDIMWGPHAATGPAFSGHYEPSKYQVTCSAGYVYIAGTVASTAPPSTPTAPVIAPWPTVVTAYIRAAAEGTYFIVDVEDALVRIYRLGESGTSKVKVWVGDDSTGMLILSGSVTMVVHAKLVSGTWTTIAPPALTSAEEAWVTGIKSAAAERGIRVPPS